MVSREVERAELSWSIETSMSSRQSETALLSRKSPFFPAKLDTAETTFCTAPTVDLTLLENSDAGTLRHADSPRSACPPLEQKHTTITMDKRAFHGEGAMLGFGYKAFPPPLFVLLIYMYMIFEFGF